MHVERSRGPHALGRFMHAREGEGELLPADRMAGDLNALGWFNQVR